MKGTSQRQHVGSEGSKVLGATVHIDRLSLYPAIVSLYTHTVVRTIVSVQSTSVADNKRSYWCHDQGRLLLSKKEKEKNSRWPQAARRTRATRAATLRVLFVSTLTRRAATVCACRRTPHPRSCVYDNTNATPGDTCVRCAFAMAARRTSLVSWSHARRLRHCAQTRPAR